MSACNSEPLNSPANPDQFIVIKNELGLRGAFVDQANIVTWGDSTITVQSAMDPNFERRYAVRDSVIEQGGEPAEYWRWKRVGRDTLTLYDPVNDNEHTLLRLRRLEPHKILDSLIVQGAWQPVVDTSSYAFLKEVERYFIPSGEATGCWVEKSLRRSFIRGQSKDGRPDLSDTFYQLSESLPQRYRIDHRFGQPMVAISAKGGNYQLILVDSVRADTGTIYGRRVQTASFNEPSTIAWKATKADPDGLLTDLRNYAGQSSNLVSSTTLDRSSWARFSYGGKEARRGIYLPEFELKNLSMRIEEGNRFTLFTPDRQVATGSIVAHPSLPVFINGDPCNVDNYMPYERRGDTLRVNLPLRVHLPLANATVVASAHNAEAIRYTYEAFTADFVLGEILLTDEASK